MSTETDTDASRIIDALGGPTKIAGEIKLTKGAVSHWRRNGIPDGWLAYFVATRPHLFAPRKARSKP